MGKQIRNDVKMTVQQIKQRYGIIGNSKALNMAVEMALQVAPTDVAVLIYGENGTGKDVFSRIIHDNSRRKHNKFIAINTGAIPEGTLDSELFGHEKGAFTSAYESRKGYFEEVENGTIFMDEIGEMPMATQARLLRLLENGEFLRVGSSKVQKADVRVITATNKNLLDLIRQGKFREDLYFRLNAITIFVPPLRERGDDIELLFNYFAQEFADRYKREAIVLDPLAVHLLYEYRWPGNVRELKNLVEKLTLLAKDEWVDEEFLARNLQIQPTYLPSVLPYRPAQGQKEEQEVNRKDVDMLYKLIYDLGKEVTDLKKLIYLGMQNRGGGEQPAGFSGSEGQGFSPSIPATAPPRKEVPQLEESLSLARKEKELIIKALNKHQNNRKKAAKDLGISERTLYRKIKSYDIDT